MRRLVFALAAATAVGATPPANAQTYAYPGQQGYVTYGYSDWISGGEVVVVPPRARAYRNTYEYPSYGAYGYPDWGPRADVYVRAPRARAYAYDYGPRYRARRFSRDWDDSYDAYAYSNPYRSRGYWTGGPSVDIGVGYGGPYVGAGVGFGDYGYPNWR